jgi:hypothetical protein
MKTIFARIFSRHTFPAVLAIIVWILGNAVVNLPAAHGQEVAMSELACQTHVNTIYTSDCANQSSMFGCTGYYKYTIYTSMSCGGLQFSDYPCVPITRDNVPETVHYGYCYTPSYGMPCVHAGDAPGYPQTIYENNVAWCAYGLTA